MDEGRPRFKQEPLSPGSRPGHDLMAMQQTYHQGEPRSQGGAIDMSQGGGRSATITAGMPYISDTMTSYAPSTHDVTPAYVMQDRNLMLGMYGYTSMISEGKGSGHVDILTNGMESNEPNGCDVPPETVQPKLRNTALPGMGKRSHLPKRYKCAMCAYRTRYKSDLNRHVRKHAVATFNCEICNMPFKTIGNVEFHKRKEHADLIATPAVTTSGSTVKEQTPKHSCKYCDYSTSYSSDLTRHVRKHLSSKFHCDICNRPFMTFSSLTTHKRTTHSGDKQVLEVIGSDGECVMAEDVRSVTEDGTIEDCVADREMDEATLGPQVNGTANGRPEEESREDVGCEEKKGDKKIEEDENGNIADINRVSLENEGNNTDQSLAAKSPPDGLACTKYTCEYCDKSFGRKLVLDYHLKNIHKIGKSGQEDTDVFVEYPDDDYDLALDMSIQELENSTSDGLAERTLEVNGKLRHQCHLCAYATNYKSTFDRHVRKHDLECHICDICRMPFITFGHLQRHIRENHPEHSQRSSRKETTDGRSVLYDFPPNDNRVAHSPPPSRFKMEVQIPSQGSFRGSTVNKSTMLSPVKSQQGDGTGTCWTSQRRLPSVEEGVTSSPPSSGRYAKLVSDYDSFAEKPFACALCFYRTGDVASLVEHAENHLTGCSVTPVPDTCMFKVGNSMSNGAVDLNRQVKCPTIPTYSVFTSASSSGRDHVDGSAESLLSNDISHSHYMYSNRTRAYMPKTLNPSQIDHSGNQCLPNNKYQVQEKVSKETKMDTQIPPQQMQFPKVMASVTEKRLDRMIPTFSVHYRKDKTNKVRPYLCLLCRKRFRHLMLLKQHFKVTHSESQVGNTRFYTCRICKEVFDNPMLLQEHHDINH
ncbi:zinc finger protein 728-like [Argopecten irradians]|uniref:zinc finger protein 728-like n=1 Tax=Argopecten irradians TaxID=31199 RepID=UPI0037164779